MKAGLAVLALAFAFSSISLAQAGTSDPDLSGTWADSANNAAKLVISEKGDTIKVRETDGDKVLANYTCSLNGTKCEIKEDGRSENLMIYYNGSKLVEIKERGSEVQKRRFSLSNDGKTMEMEIIPMSSAGKTITRTYQKQDSQVANSSL